jgi:hypothetical protein
MANPNFDRRKALKVLTDALTMGDRTACERHKISGKTLMRYRKRLEGDPELSLAVLNRVKQEDLEWGAQRRAFLAEGLAKMRELIKQATVAELGAVSGALKVAGDLQIACEALGVGSPDHRQGGAAEEAPSDDAGGEGEGEGARH